MKKQIAILGSTGSIGTQALQVIEEHPDRYEAYVLTANNRVDDLIAQGVNKGTCDQLLQRITGVYAAMAAEKA